MRQGTARGPSKTSDSASPHMAEPARSHQEDAIDFLEAAARHLRDAGYSVELEFDRDAGEASLYVDGVEIRFVRNQPPGPVKH